ncbi:transposase [Flectobacillus roseus]
MKSSKYSPTEIAKILKEFESGKSLDTIVREYGVSKVTFYEWRQRYDYRMKKQNTLLGLRVA